MSLCVCVFILTQSCLQHFSVTLPVHYSPCHNCWTIALRSRQHCTLRMGVSVDITPDRPITSYHRWGVWYAHISVRALYTRTQLEKSFINCGMDCRPTITLNQNTTISKSPHKSFRIEGNGTLQLKLFIECSWSLTVHNYLFYCMVYKIDIGYADIT